MNEKTKPPYPICGWDREFYLGDEQEDEMKEELKPCPFCGGDAEIEQTGKSEYRIRCRECHIGIKQRVLRYSLEWLRDKLIDKWNTRPETPKHETVEEWEKRTGKVYPDDGPVWIYRSLDSGGFNDWYLGTRYPFERELKPLFIANENGKPEEE